MITWHYKDLAISFKTNFQFYSNLVIEAKFLSPFGKFLPQKNHWVGLLKSPWLKII
jgi:hypothetical protein